MCAARIPDGFADQEIGPAAEARGIECFHTAAESAVIVGALPSIIFVAAPGLRFCTIRY